SKEGDVFICNAGHPPALFNRGNQVESITATGFPLGMFPNQKFSVERLKLESGDNLVLYTDGVPEALNSQDEEYGMSRLIDILTTSRALSPEKLVAACLSDVTRFRQGSPRF